MLGPIDNLILKSKALRQDKIPLNSLPLHGVEIAG